jgi:gluconate 2-dehydrogenase gamma chain
MASRADNEKLTLSRRELFKRVGIVGAAAAAAPPRALLATPGTAVPVEAASPAQAPVLSREALENFTAAEAATIEAVVARLIPTDANGPGAAEARAARYIDRALGGALASSREAYRSGLSAVDSYARTSKGAPFAQLSPQDQDAVLSDMERNVATGFTPSAAAFFGLVRTHTIQGTFCDPYYGGNANFVGWDLIGYPGLRLAVSANDQRLDPNLKPTRKSAYDEPMFSNKRPARASLEEEAPPSTLRHTQGRPEPSRGTRGSGYGYGD